MNKKIVSIMLICMSVNNVFGATVDVGNLNMGSNSLSSTADKELIAERETYKFALSEAEGDTKGEGKYGVNAVFAYVTPDKKVGATWLDSGFDLNGDDASSFKKSDVDGGIFSGISVYSGKGPNRAMASRVYDAFNTDSTSKRLDSLDVDVTDTSKYLIQYSESRKEKYIANTLYVRWMYDMNNNRSFPTGGGNILYNGGANGPYFVLDDTMDNDDRYSILNVSNEESYKNGTAVANINNLVGSKVKHYSDLSLSLPSGSTNAFSQDMGFSNAKSYFKEGGKALFEKRSEYRRYYTNNGVAPEYEYVYPYEEVKSSSRKVLPNMAPKVTLNIEPVMDSSYIVQYYNVNTNIAPVKKSYNGVYGDNNVTYRKQNDSLYLGEESGAIDNGYINREPRENEIDMWNVSKEGSQNLYGKLTIKDSSGAVVYEHPDAIKEGAQSFKIYPSQINSKDGTFGNCNAKLELEYKLNSRFMSVKEIYTDKYSLDGSYKDGLVYSKIEEYVSKVEGKVDTAKSEIKAYHDKVAREYLTYETITLPSAQDSVDSYKISASQDISYVAPIDSDPVAPSVKIDITPPNPLTSLEGGNFYVETEIKFVPSPYPDGSSIPTTTPNEKEYTVDKFPDYRIPDGEFEKASWHDNVFVTSLKVVTARGNVLFKAEGSDMNQVFENGVLKIPTNLVTANPDDIGEAKVIVEYKYRYNFRSRTKMRPGEIIDVEGNKQPTDYKVTYETKSYEYSGKQELPFYISSLTGITV